MKRELEQRRDRPAARPARAGTDAAQAYGRGEVRRMDNKKVDEFELALSEFVKRASQKDATAEEVEALPAVARVLLDAIRDLP